MSPRRTMARRQRSAIGMRLLAILALAAGVAAQDALMQKLQRIPGLTAAPPQARDAGAAVSSGNIWIVPAERK